MTSNPHAANTMNCPVCGAWAGTPCVGPGFPHLGRRMAYTRSLREQQAWLAERLPLQPAPPRPLRAPAADPLAAARRFLLARFERPL